MSMLTYTEGHPASRRVLGLAIAIAVHLLLLWALMSGLASDIVKSVQEPLQVSLLSEPPKPAPPDIPPPEMVKPPEAYVPPPVVKAPPPSEPQRTIQQVQTTKPEPAPPVRMQAKPVPPRPDTSSRNTQPPYPGASRRMGEEGRVLLMLYVAEDGRVTDGRVDVSSGFPRLDKAALMHARRTWRFNPAMLNGKPVGFWMKFAVNFRLTD